MTHIDGSVLKQQIHVYTFTSYPKFFYCPFLQIFSPPLLLNDPTLTFWPPPPNPCGIVLKQKWQPKIIVSSPSQSWRQPTTTTPSLGGEVSKWNGRVGSGEYVLSFSLSPSVCLFIFSFLPPSVSSSVSAGHGNWVTSAVLWMLLVSQQSFITVCLSTLPLTCPFPHHSNSPPLILLMSMSYHPFPTLVCLVLSIFIPCDYWRFYKHTKYGQRD